MKYLPIILLLLIFSGNSTLLRAQESSSVSIKSFATVINRAEIEVLTIQDMFIDESMAEDGLIYISAKYDAEAAVMMIKGRAGAKFRISYISELEIENTAGKGNLSFRYEIYGYPEDNQDASESIDAVDRVLKISDKGEYYFWVGGYIDIKNASPGSYEGEFNIEIEYI